MQTDDISNTFQVKIRETREQSIHLIVVVNSHILKEMRDVNIFINFLPSNAAIIIPKVKMLTLLRSCVE